MVWYIVVRDGMVYCGGDGILLGGGGGGGILYCDGGGMVIHFACIPNFVLQKGGFQRTERTIFLSMLSHFLFILISFRS